MAKFETLNDLNLKVMQGDKTLVDEICCTTITIALNNDGDVFTSFAGSYNPQILKLLKNVHKTYYNNLLKKLKEQEKQKNSETTEQTEAQKPEKVKKVHERKKTKKQEDTENLEK